MEGISQSRCLVVLLSPDSVVSDEVLAEIDAAERLNKPIIPVIVRGNYDAIDGPVKERIALIHGHDATSERGTLGDIRPLLRALKRQAGRVAPVIAFSNLKGGVGKTTLAAQIASAIAAKDRYSILVIDLDPQANLTQLVLKPERHAELVSEDQSVLSLFEQSLVYGAHSPRSSLTSVSSVPIAKPEISRIATHVQQSNLSRRTARQHEFGSVNLVPGQFELVKYTLPTASQALLTLRSNFERAIFEARKDYDAVLIDLNPSSSFMIQCALSCATHIVCPIKPDIYSVQGLQGLKRLIGSAFALEQPPQIISLLNGIPSWEEYYLRRIEKHLDSPNELSKLASDRKKEQAICVVADLLRSDMQGVQLLRTHVPDTAMLQAYSDEAGSLDFVRLAQHLFSGPYGTKLAKRLSTIASEIIAITGMDALRDSDTSSAAQEA